MHDAQIRVAIAGAGGRMGRQLIQAALQMEERGAGRGAGARRSSEAAHEKRRNLGLFPEVTVGGES